LLPSLSSVKIPTEEEEVFLNASCVGGFVFASSLSSSASARPQCSQLDGGPVYNRIRTGFADSIRGAAWRPVAKYSREFWTRQKMSAVWDGRALEKTVNRPTDGLCTRNLFSATKQRQFSELFLG